MTGCFGHGFHILSLTIVSDGLLWSTLCRLRGLWCGKRLGTTDPDDKLLQVCIYSITVYEPVVTFWLKVRILHVVITQSSHIIILHSIKWIRKHLPDHNKRTKVRQVWPQCGDRGHPSIPWELRPYWTMKFYIQWQHSVHMQTVVR